MPEFNSILENVLKELDEHLYLFPQFELKKWNNELKLLGTGGFSYVYEMYNKERPNMQFALKVMGLQQHTISSADFWNAVHIQWILCHDSAYITRILDAKELLICLDDDGRIIDVKDVTKEVWEEKGTCLHMQFVLMEKLDELIEKDRFGRVKYLKEKLRTEREVLKFALEIGQALAVSHDNKYLHRDIKIENIFWDALEKIYKLGDFGMSKCTKDGNAETIIYTDGYGAPEIERKLYRGYNITADIYSFGITLYLLLNDLRFPGSDGYYVKPEVQYNPEFIFPAPVHASEEMTRVIRKMCSFSSEERYQSMNEVLTELTGVLEMTRTEKSGELIELADIVTETFKADKDNNNGKQKSGKQEKTRAERKEEQKIIDMLYREDSVKYFAVITVLLTLLYKGLQPEYVVDSNWMLYILSGAVLLEAVLQRLKEFYLSFGIIILFCIGASIYSTGVTTLHIIWILCVIINCPVLTLAGAVSAGLWIVLELTGSWSFLNYISKWDLGWLFFTAVLFVIKKYFNMRIEWGKTTYIRASVQNYIYDKMGPVMFFLGGVLFILQKYVGVTVPYIVRHLHLIKTGIVLFIGIILFRGTNLEKEEETGELENRDDEFLDR